MFGDIRISSIFPNISLDNFAQIGSSKRVHAADYVESGIPFYRSKEIIELGNGQEPSVELFISKKQYECIRKTNGVPCKGDILMSAVGTIGKMWIVDGQKDFYYKDGNIISIHSEETNPIYLKEALANLIDDFKSANVAGSAYSALTIVKLKKMTVPMPPISLQNEFADFVQQIDKSQFVEMFGDPIDNPNGWNVKPLKELSSLITNGNTPKGGSENYIDNGVTFLRSQNIWRNKIDLSDVVYIDEITHRKMQKSSVRYKDILITKTGRVNTENSSLGRAALFLGKDGTANINGHVYLVRLNNSVVPEYVVTILTGEAYRKYIRKVCVGGIDKRQINLDQVEDFPIILPPIEQQNQFADFVKTIDKSKFDVQLLIKNIRRVKFYDQF